MQTSLSGAVPAVKRGDVEARVVLGDHALEAELASYLRIEERKLEAGGLNRPRREEAPVRSLFEHARSLG